MNVLKIVIFCLLLFDNCSGCPCQTHHTSKYPLSSQERKGKRSRVKREPTEHLKISESNNLKGVSVQEETVRAGNEDAITSPVATRTPAKLTATTIRAGYSCKCHLKDIRKQTFHVATVRGILQTDTDKDAIATDFMKRSAEESTTSTPFTDSPTLDLLRGFVLNETHFELKEPEFETSIDIREVCPHYRLIPELNVKRMADVWQLIYYKAHESLSCFKIFLKRTTPESRDYFKRKYSSFDETINWDESYLELSPTGKPNKARHHFLQGPKKGILENIVITDESLQNNTKIIILHEQAPGQWLVTKKLLLMRDCDNGDIVVLRRVPAIPSMKDIEEAMTLFGEDGIRNIVPCNDDYKIEKVPKWNLKHHIPY